MDMSQLKLEQPLFYNWPYGLRFEIGPPDLETWDDFDKGYLNDAYFEKALERAIAIFESAFSADDQISLVYQLFSDGRRRIRKSDFLFKQITHLDAKEIKFTTRRDLYRQDLLFRRHCWRRVTMSNMTAQELSYRNILKAAIHTDFRRRRKPSLYGELYFINHTKDLVLLLYDDRGMDIVSVRKAPLIPIYMHHNDWILDSNRKAIESVFSDVAPHS